MNANTTPFALRPPSGARPHDPELDSRRARALGTVERHLDDPTCGELLNCLPRLLASLPRPEALHLNTVLVMYGGGKDSSYLLAATRYLQLEIARHHPSTFRLRVATNRHAGMPRAVLENIGRVYAALECDGDPDVELLLIDGQKVTPFCVRSPLPLHVRARNREDILVTGHRTRGILRSTFCNACNLSMVNAMALGLGYEGGADVMVTGDSPREQRDYFRWTLKTARRFGVGRGEEGGAGLRPTLTMLRGISGRYFDNLYSGAAGPAAAHHDVPVEAIEREPVFFSIFEDTRYEAGAHWDLLTRGLHFVFDELAFAFSESDCGNPALMAHIQGLKMERLHGRDYRQGVEEYVRFATGLMRQKNFPAQLIETVERRYNGPEAVGRMRRKMDAYAKEAFYLGETQLVCLVYAPFTASGKYLEEYLRAEQPHLLEHAEEIRRLLAGEQAPDPSHLLARELSNISGLTFDHLRMLYRSPLSGEGTPAQDPIMVVLEKDPHKAVVRSDRGDGKYVEELLTGR
jgi:hypothetical protein